jgi:hypothetical protein
MNVQCALRERGTRIHLTMENLEQVKKFARDLNKEEPRGPGEKLGGFQLAARALDKCRASLAGTNGTFEFNCPMDQRFFSESGIKAGEFREFVATGATDEEVGRWIEEHATGG